MGNVIGEKPWELRSGRKGNTCSWRIGDGVLSEIADLVNYAASTMIQSITPPMDHAGFEAPKNSPTSKQVHVAKLRLRCFAVADRCLDRVVRFMKIVHEGFWLGCLSPDELNAVTAEHFDHSQFFSSNGHNRSGFFQWEQKTLDQFFRRGWRVLVAGAGGGREVLALRHSGFEAQGFECSPALVDASQRIFDELGESDYLVHCPPDTVPPGPPTYDALIVGWTVYTHIPTRDRRIRFLEDLRKRALPHAPVLISFFARQDLSIDAVLVYRLAKVRSLFARARRETVEIGDHISFARYVHAFTEDELAEELKHAGFRVAHFAQEGDWGYAVGIARES